MSTTPPTTRAGWLNCEHRTDQERCTAKSIICRKHLVEALKDGAELEHYLMCMYLYAALSLKRYPDEACTAAQVEVVRRWASQIFMVARQEMEHLALVNGIFSAIGAPAYFIHSDDFQNRPLQSFQLNVHADGGSGLEPKQFAFSLDRFSPSTMDTFSCVESPPWDKVRDKPDEPCWCFLKPGENAAPALSARRAFRHFSPPAAVPQANTLQAVEEAGAGTVVELYTAAEHAINTIPEDILFAKPGNQVYVIAQYDIYVIPVTDRSSALEAIRLILHQGEGNLSDPAVTSHFDTFVRIRGDLNRMQHEDPKFDPALNLVANPRPEAIPNEFTRDMLKVSAYSYGTMLMVLTAVYDHYVTTGSAQDVYPHFSEALFECVFAPMMTMVIRKQGEILTMLPTGRANERTGPAFDIPADVKALLESHQAGNGPELTNIDTFVDRFEHLTEDVLALVGRVNEIEDEVCRERVRQELEFLHQNAYRMTNNLKLVYQQGKFSQF